MFFDSEYDLLRVLVLGTLGYTWLLIIIRLTGKRTLAQLNAFDLIVSVALGSTLASVLLSSDVALAEGAVALALLCVLQLVVALLTSRSKVARRTITARPTLLVRNGELLDQAMRSERISRDSRLQVVQPGRRRAGAGSCGGAGDQRAVQRHHPRAAGQRLGTHRCALLTYRREPAASSRRNLNGARAPGPGVDRRVLSAAARRQSSRSATRVTIDDRRASMRGD